MLFREVSRRWVEKFPGRRSVEVERRTGIGVLPWCVRLRDRGLGSIGGGRSRVSAYVDALKGLDTARELALREGVEVEKVERTFEVGQRVVVAIGDRRKWSASAAEALDGTPGVVSEVKPGYEYPAVGACVGSARTGYLVELDREVRLDDRVATRPVRAFHFLADDLELERVVVAGEPGLVARSALDDPDEDP